MHPPFLVTTVTQNDQNGFLLFKNDGYEFEKTP
jgi:hypothetical protein